MTAFNAGWCLNVGRTVVFALLVFSHIPDVIFHIQGVQIREMGLNRVSPHDILFEVQLLHARWGAIYERAILLQ